MKISDIRATTVTVPIEAPLRHANGCHWGRFVRTIIEVETDEGLVGLGEMGGGGESAGGAFHVVKSYVVGHDPPRLKELQFLFCNPTACSTTIARRCLRRSSLRVLIFSDKSGACLFRKFSVGVCASACRSLRTCSFVMRTRRVKKARSEQSSNWSKPRSR